MAVQYDTTLQIIVDVTAWPLGQLRKAGAHVGDLVGARVGAGVGEAVGCCVGASVGIFVGAPVGACVGAGVGAQGGSFFPRMVSTCRGCDAL